MKVDDGRLGQLIEESQDLHSTAMRQTTQALDEVVENHMSGASAAAEPVDDRRGFLSRGLFAAGTIGAGLGALYLSKAVINVAADSASDVQMLQTSAAIENLAIAVYKKAATLPPAVSGASNPVILAFVEKTIAQHTDHAKAFNAALTLMSAKTQTGLDTTVYNAVVTPALAKIKGPADVVGLAITLEDAAAQTYVKFGAAVDPNGKGFAPLSTIAPVEAQHVAVLLAVQALLNAGAPQLIALPAPLAKLPAAAGDLGFPNSFYKTDQARPAAEGAVAG